ncbi:hypothetical protein MUK42_18971 [Musa troglodytarum]|uniref:BHLH domain-containing protein n=1 Tax=Musa troglodytarum TaxID=320322 RepID=A0A9E7G0M1_9LILI|nr:hypothetical protein MUK42_18971 [Musa troglodytarum]URE06631.1 hypothetical protein MUK42_18971 [Musa troglodytarum]
MVVDHHSAEEFPTMQGYLQKKRKSRDVICLSPEKSNEDTEERKGSRQKKSTEETSTPDRKRHRAQVSREPPTGYIYVRAKRGQATDSHSLAERVRREKINQRMKLLQGIVPGCDKIAGKILMLDEIINYVLSLQRQVEFLSMKLASMDPKFCGLFAASIGYVNQQQETGKMPQLSVPVQSVLRNSAIQQVAFDEATGNSISHPLVHGQGATGIPSGCFTATIPSGKMPQFPQDDEACLLTQVADQRHELFNEVFLNNISFFPVN